MILHTKVGFLTILRNAFLVPLRFHHQGEEMPRSVMVAAASLTSLETHEDCSITSFVVLDGTMLVFIFLVYLPY